MLSVLLERAVSLITEWIYVLHMKILILKKWSAAFWLLDLLFDYLIFHLNLCKN